MVRALRCNNATALRLSVSIRRSIRQVGPTGPRCESSHFASGAKRWTPPPGSPTRSAPTPVETIIIGTDVSYYYYYYYYYYYSTYMF